MPILRATVKLNPTNGKPEDTIVNVWHMFMNTALTPTNAAPIGAAMATFYGTWSAFLSAALSRTALHEIAFSQLDVGAAGPDDDVATVPLLHYAWGTQMNAASSQVNLPREVAVCLSMAGALAGYPEDGPGITRPRARRRGRVFLGPFNGDILAASGAGSGQPIVATAARTAIVNAMGAMYNTLDNLTVPATPGVYSPTNGTIALLNSWWVDNAFDTMRSRGTEATDRTVLTVNDI